MRLGLTEVRLRAKIRSCACYSYGGPFCLFILLLVYTFVLSIFCCVLIEPISVDNVNGAVGELDAVEIDATKLCSKSELHEAYHSSLTRITLSEHYFLLVYSLFALHVPQPW